MPRKTREFETEIPIKLCFEVLHTIGDHLSWQLIEANPTIYSLKWQHKTYPMAPATTIYADLKPLGDHGTKINLTGELGGWGIDGPGHIPKALDSMQMPLENFIAEAEPLLRDGLMCPNCAMRLSSGTKFCPNDGTPIGRECSSCKHINIPSARFCANCGNNI